MKKETLKDWYVNLQKVEVSNLAYERYMLSEEEHPNQTITLLSNKDNVLKIDTEEYWYREKYQSNQKARKVTNGKDLIMSLPYEVGKNLTPQDWKDCYSYVMKKVYSTLLENNKERFNLENENIQNITNELVSKCYLTHHLKPKPTKNSEATSHIHSIIPTIYFNDRINFPMNKEISEKKYTYLMKKEFDNWLRTHKGIKKEEYVIKDRTNQYKNYKRKKSTRKDYEDLHNAYKEQTKKLNEQEEKIEQSVSEMRELKQSINEQNNILEERLDKLKEILNEIVSTQQVKKGDIEKMNKLVSTAEKQLSNGNTERFERTINNLEKKQSSLKTM